MVTVAFKENLIPVDFWLLIITFQGKSWYFLQISPWESAYLHFPAVSGVVLFKPFDETVFDDDAEAIEGARKPRSENP